MDRCKICHSEIKDKSEYCLNCKELGLDHRYFNTPFASMEPFNSKDDITAESEDYLPKDYSILDTGFEDLTENKELQILLNKTVPDEQLIMEHSIENDEIGYDATLKSSIQDLEDKQVENEQQEIDKQQEIDEQQEIKQQEIDEQQEKNELQEENEQKVENEQQVQNVLDEYNNASLEDYITNDLLSELVTTEEKHLIEEDKLNVSDLLGENLTSNKYKEVEGEFAVGSTPDFDGNQDILDLLNEINRTPEDDNQEDYVSDVLSIDDFMDDEETIKDPILSLYGDSDELLNSTMKDIGGIYQDSLDGISDLKDVGIDEELLKLIPDIPNQEEVKPEEIENLEIKSKKSKKQTKEKHRSGSKKNLFSRIFGNVKEEYSEEEKERLKQEIIEEARLKEAKVQEAEKEKKAAKVKKKADKLAEKKKAKEDALKAKQAKAEKAKAKKEEKERISKEVQELIDEIDENEGRINRIGASFVFALFASIAVFVVIGTNIYSYAINVQNATKSFSMQRYNEAYNEVYGLEIKDADIEIYDKIMTVMFVNKQLNSYNNYSAIGMYPQALDSLLKGLERYDKYYTLATKLGIQTDLDYVRNQIVKELDNVFYLSVEEAYDIIDSPTQLDYSVGVHNVILERLDDKLVQKTDSKK